MTSGLVKERKTFFHKGYAVQWFHSVLKDTKILIYGDYFNQYIHMSDITLDYIANDAIVEMLAIAKIEEIESYE